MTHYELINESHYTINETVIDDIIRVFDHFSLFSEDAQFCIKLDDSGLISSYNQRYRGKNQETDVLSFPSEFAGIPFLGDILIDMRVADMQKGSKSLMEEFSELIIHGLLHLKGYDHLNDIEKRKMKEIEVSIQSELKKIQIQRECKNYRG